MPRKSILTTSERISILAMPEAEIDLIRQYTFSESDLSIIRQHRGDVNRLGFSVLLCYMRYPGVILGVKEKPLPAMLNFVAKQLDMDVACWSEYGKREQTRREHILELQEVFNLKIFTMKYYKAAVQSLLDQALQTNKGVLLATTLINYFRERLILLPSINVIERICAEAITWADRQIFKTMVEPLTHKQKMALDSLLKVKESGPITTMMWLRQSPGAPNAKHLLEHLERLSVLQSLEIPEGIEQKVHQNRLLKIAREGGQMSPNDLSKFGDERRLATLMAVAIDSKATLIDETIDLHDRIIGKLINRAKRNHEQQFHQSGKKINDKIWLYCRIGKALMEAKQNGTDPFSAIESVMPWESFTKSIIEAEKLAQSKDFDFLYLISDGYTQIRRYAPKFLETLSLVAAPSARSLLKAVELLKELNENKTRNIPENAPISFIRKRWKGLIFKADGLDRRYYELCVLSELKNSLRSGDIWVCGSRQFKNFNEYLLPIDKYDSLKQTDKLSLGVTTNCDQYLKDRIMLLKQQLEIVNRMAKKDDLPDVVITESGLKITPLATIVPAEADLLMRKASGLLPHIKITDLLMEVEEWTGFSRHFTNIKTGATVTDKKMLLTAILSDAINLGLTKMAESCPGTTYSKLSWLQAWHIRDETYAAALGDLVNAQLRQPFAEHWGDGTTSSSDGQRFKTGGHAERGGNINPKYGSEPGVQFYTHVSDQYSPFHTKVINVGVRDATYVLDGLLYHESDLRIEEHYTDTAGFTDHVFALMHLLGFRFAPRIRDLADKRLYTPDKKVSYSAINTLIGGTLNIKQIHSHWDEILRLATSIKQGTVTASLVLRKLSSYPRQNGLAIALRELGRIERDLFMLDWFQNVELRRRVNAGLNKGEARNALARAIFFNRLGEMRDRSFENQRYRASGLTLVTAAIVLWNTVYLERAVTFLKQHGHSVDDSLLQYLSPLGWEHINLTGDYVWSQRSLAKTSKFRPLRPLKNP